jgi:hypothetical protein
MYRFLFTTVMSLEKVRNIVLYTMCSSERNNAESILKQRGISFFTEVVNTHKVNIFFGNPNCVEVIKLFSLISILNTRLNRTLFWV